METTEDNQIFEDETIVCCDCGESFTWTAGEQEYFYGRGLNKPRRCPKCRKLRRDRVSSRVVRNG